MNFTKAITTTICALSHYAAKLRVGFLLALSPLLTVPLGAQTPHFTFDGVAVNDRLGHSVAGAGDVNQDGFDDVIVGAPYADPGGTFNAGSAYVYTIFQASFSVFGNGCSGSVGTPELAIASGHLPLIGETFNIQLSGMPTSVVNVPFGVLGFSKTQWGGIPLPYDLSNLGFWNCTQFVSLDFSIGLVNNGGVATWAIPVPNNPNLIGLTFYVQGVVIDFGVNPGNAIVTNAAEGVIGG